MTLANNIKSWWSFRNYSWLYLSSWQTQKFKNKSPLSLDRKSFANTILVKFALLLVWSILLANSFACMPTSTTAITRISFTILDRQNSYFGPFFTILHAPNNPYNQNFEKMKKHLDTSSFHTSVPLMTIIWYMVPEIWSATDRMFCQLGPSFAHFPP